MSHGYISCGTGRTIKVWVANNPLGFSRFPVQSSSMTHILSLRCTRSWQFSSGAGSPWGHAGTLAPSPTQATQAPAAQQGCGRAEQFPWSPWFHVSSETDQLSSSLFEQDSQLYCTIKCNTFCADQCYRTQNKEHRTWLIPVKNFSHQENWRMENTERGHKAVFTNCLIFSGTEIPSSTLSGNWLSHLVL